MKNKTRLFAIVAVLALVVAACGDSDDSTGGGAAEGFTDLEGRTVTVGVENAYLPFNFIPLGGTEGEGWDYDAWTEICKLLNCQAEFVEAGWPAVIDQVAQGDLDTAADGISITDERKEIVDYSDSYMIVQQKFIVQKGDDRYADAQAVIDSDAVVATQVGTTNYELAETLVGADRIQAFDQFALAIQALIAGDGDVVIIDDGLQSDPLGFIFPLGSDLVGPVNEAIQELKDNGVFETLGVKWFGVEFDLGYDDIEEVG